MITGMLTGSLYVLVFMGILFVGAVAGILGWWAFHKIVHWAVNDVVSWDEDD